MLNFTFMKAIDTAKAYYDAFNRKDWQGMLNLVAEDIIHAPNQGQIREGKVLFEAFLQKMDTAYEESLTEMVFYTEPSDAKIAVQFVVNGVYKVAEEGMPKAYGQIYTLPAAAFLEVENGLIKKVTTYYNLEDWLQQVGG